MGANQTIFFFMILVFVANEVYFSFYYQVLARYTSNKTEEQLREVLMIAGILAILYYLGCNIKYFLLYI